MTIDEKIKACRDAVMRAIQAQTLFGSPGPHLRSAIGNTLREHFGASAGEPHVWTHPAEDCDVEGCMHRTVRTCEQAEHEKKFLRRIIKGLRDRLYKADPNAAKQDWNRLMRALEMPEDFLFDDVPADSPAKSSSAPECVCGYAEDHPPAEPSAKELPPAIRRCAYVISNHSRDSSPIQCRREDIYHRPLDPSSTIAHPFVASTDQKGEQ